MIDSKEKERINFLGINVSVLTKDDIIQEIIKFARGKASEDMKGRTEIKVNNILNIIL